MTTGSWSQQSWYLQAYRLIVGLCLTFSAGNWELVGSDPVRKDCWAREVPLCEMSNSEEVTGRWTGQSDRPGCGFGPVVEVDRLWPVSEQFGTWELGGGYQSNHEAANQTQFFKERLQMVVSSRRGSSRPRG